jgi:hypothetical protein
MANSPSPRIAFSPAIQALDVQVVAGRSYVFTACAGTVAIYQWRDIRMGGSQAIIPKGEHLVLVKTLDLQQIFNALYGPDDPTHPRPHNVNAALAQAWNWRPDPNHPNDPRLGVIPCFVEDPFDWRGNLFEPDTNGNPSSRGGPTRIRSVSAATRKAAICRPAHAFATRPMTFALLTTGLATSTS